MKKFLLKALLAPIAALPLKVHYFNADIIAWLLYAFRYRKDDVIMNLSRSFPDKDYDWIIDCAKRFYRHFSDVIVESIWFGGCHGPERLKKANLVVLTNTGRIRQLFDKSPSMIVLMAHTGNWELIGGIATYGQDHPITENNFCISYLKQTNKVFDEFMRDNRFAPLDDPKNFKGYLESRQIVRYIIEHRDEKKFYSIITDQRPYFGNSTMEVDFMHQRCHTMNAGAKFANKMGMSVCFLKMTVESRGHYKMEFVPICEDGSRMEPQEIMQRYYKLIEEQLNEQPWNYLWTHRRWCWWG